MSRLFDDALNDLRLMSRAKSLSQLYELYERYSNTINKAFESTRLSKQDTALLGELDDAVMIILEEAVGLLGGRLYELLVDFSDFIQSSSSRLLASSSDVDLDFAFNCLEDAEDLKRLFADAVAMQNRGREGDVGEGRLLGFADSFVSEYSDIGSMSRTLPESAESYLVLESVITRTYSDYHDEGRYDAYGVRNIYRALGDFCTVLKAELG